MSTTPQQIMEDIKTAMKAKDSTALLTLRALKSALTNAAIEKGNLHTELTSTEIHAVIRKQIKQREDAATQYKKADRPELAEKEEAEIAVLLTYLPPPLSAEEVVLLVDTVIAELGMTSKKEMKTIMKILQERSQGRADSKDFVALLSQKLS